MSEEEGAAGEREGDTYSVRGPRRSRSERRKSAMNKLCPVKRGRRGDSFLPVGGRQRKSGESKAVV